MSNVILGVAADEAVKFSAEEFANTITPFRPVKCTEKAKDKRDPVEGFVYYTTDSKKIYLGSNGKYLPMGGNSGIYYGNREISEEEAELTALTFYIYDIEGDMVPNKDDLILNIPDGCFYRVNNVLQISEIDYEIYTEKLTIAGSGGGGGGGSASSNIAITDIDNTYSKFFTIDDETMKIAFTCRSQVATDNYVDTIEYRIGRTIIYTDDNDYNFGNTVTFDLKNYTNYLSTGTTNTLTVKATDVWGNTGTKTYQINLVELKLESDYDKIVTIEEKSLIYSCKPVGGNTLSDRYVRIKVYNEEDINNVVFDSNIPVKFAGEVINPPVDLNGCLHGVYVLEATLHGTLPNGEIIASNTINHKIIYYDNTINTPLIAAHVPTLQVQQYEDLTITYMIVDKGSTSAVVTARLYVDDDYTNVSTTLEQMSSWKKTFLSEGNFELKISYGAATKEIGRVIVLKYSGDIPVIDTNPTDVTLEMYLTSQGRSNDEADRASWDWKNYKTKFENFLWGETNGWLEDEDGATALKLTNGAKIEIEGYYPFAQDATTYGLTVELDFTVSGVLDYSKPLIHCLSQWTTTEGKREIAAGFQMTGQKATLNSDMIKATTTDISGEGDEDGNITNTNDLSLQAYTQYFKEGERVHLTYVIESIPSSVTSNDFYYVFTYLNGVLSGIGRMSASSGASHESFKQQNAYPAKFIVDSTYGDINLYNVRFYRNGLSKRAVVNNWIADLTDIDQKIELYKENNILEDDGSISLKAIQDIAYQLKVPYVLFNGGCKMNKKKKDPISYATKPEYALPSAKDDYKLFSMKMVDDYNPSRNMDIPISLENAADSSMIDKFGQIQTNTVYNPKRGVQVYGQGTSSMVYPVKNLRLRFIQSDDYPIVYDGSCPVEIVCFKADFMDSSSSHNTGTANLVYSLLQGMNLRTPPQQFMLENGTKLEERYDITTAIRGYPIVCFYAEGDSENYQFIGRYNFNIDKATPEPFGFPPMKVYTGNTTSTGRKEVLVCGLATEEVEGMTVLPLDAEGNEIEKDLTQCWEMKNNDPSSPTKFLTLPEYSDFMSSLTTGDNWLGYYEDRYPDEIVGDTEDGKDTSEATAAWFALCNWLNSYQLFDSNGNYIDAPDENPIIIEALTKGQDNKILPRPLTAVESDSQIQSALDVVNGANTEENLTYIKDNLEKLSGYLETLGTKKDNFRAEFEDHLDLDFCLFYYCLTMTLLMMDSRAKNMMMATWDQKKWYPIFYDMDSMLGINNTGFNKFSFQTEDEIANKVFTGFDSVLWNNLRECYYNNICAFYTQMRQSGLDLETLLSIYNEGSADAWNEALSTADAEYKYIRPFEQGYYNGKDKVQVGPGKKNYLYAGQGPRSAHRAWWLQNRLAYLDSKYKPATYTKVEDIGDAFGFRCYSGPEQNASESPEAEQRYNACVALAPATQQFDITALNDSYHAMIIGTNKFGPIKLRAGETGKLGPDRPGQEVESLIFKAELISSLGDLSNKYLANLVFPSTVQTRWTELKFGRSERSHPGAWEGYYNAMIADLAIGNSCPYLNYLNIAGLTGIGSIDLSACKRLKVVDATRASTPNITFPTDSILQELYLPSAITKLQLVNQPYLHTIEFDTTSQIMYLFLDRITALNSYDLVKEVFPVNLSLEKEYYLTDVNWTIDNDNDLIISGNEITGIKILETLGHNSLAKGIAGSPAASLTGTITIKSGTAVDEYTLYEKYSLLFPNVTIKYDKTMYDAGLVTSAIKIQFMNSDEADTAVAYYEVLSDATKNIQFLTEGKTLVGKPLSAPNKTPSTEYAYEFQEKWTTIDAEGNTITLTQNEKEVDDSTLYFYTYIPTVDSVFIPIFEATTRQYTVTIYDWDESEIYKADLDYGTAYKDIAEIPSFIYRDPSKLDTYNRYAFRGYISASDFNNKNPNPTIIDLSSMNVTGNFIAYAYYEIEDATKVASDMSYFTIDNRGPGKVLTIHIANDKIRNEIKGKITLPSMYEGEPILCIGDFKDTLGITHIYFLEDAKYETTWNSYGFRVTETKASYSQLQEVYLPKSMKTIGNNCFEFCINLIDAHIPDSLTAIGTQAFAGGFRSPMKLTLDHLPIELTSLGANAFDCCSSIYLDSNLPSGLKEIPTYAFNRCSNVRINIIGVVGYNNITHVGDYAFNATASTNPPSIHISKNVEYVGRAAFATTPFAAIYFELDANEVASKYSDTIVSDNVKTKIYGNLGL